MLGNKVTTNLLLCTGIQQRTTENLFVESTRKAGEGTAWGGDAQRNTRSWYHNAVRGNYCNPNSPPSASARDLIGASYNSVVWVFNYHHIRNVETEAHGGLVSSLKGHS